MTNILVSFADKSPVTWTNGAGRTTELVSFEESTHLAPELSPWRLSVAELIAPAAFSSLPGVRRAFCPVGGDVTLSIDGVKVQAAENHVLEFDGASATELLALERSCFAVNVMMPSDSDPISVTTTPQSSSQIGVALADGDSHRRFDVLVPEALSPGHTVFLSGGSCSVAR